MTTYSISLDDVDLALLPLRTYKYNDFLKKEHFQFQVMKNEEDPEATIFYKCHICAIDVPAAFASEHAASLKHRANARIARVATQRTRSLITTHPPPVVVKPAARFCESCATIADKNHDKTKEHRVAVMHDKLLWELMTAYVGYDNEKEKNESNHDSDTESYEETVIENESRHYNAFSTFNEVNNNEEEQLKKFEPKSGLIGNETANEIYKNADNVTKVDKDKSLDGKANSEIVIETETKLSNSIGKEIAEKTAKNDQDVATPGTPKAQDKIEYIEFVNKQNKMVKEANSELVTETGTKLSNGIGKEIAEMTAKNDQDVATPSTPKAQDKIEYIEFVNKQNKMVKVFSDYYHSFTRKGDVVSCKICKISFYNDEVNSHMFTSKHLNLLPSTMIDEHCVRKIDDIFSHCIVCNQMIKNSNLAKHYLTYGHSQRENQLVTDNPNQPTTSKIRPTNDKTVDVKHVKTPEVKVNAQSEVKDWPVIYPFEMTKQGAIRCVICDCHVPNNPQNRKEHLVGLTHVTNVKNKRPLYSEEETVNCCAKRDGKVMSFEDMTELFNDHPEYNSVKLEYPYEATNSPHIARCTICDMKVTVSGVCLKGHLDGTKHTTNELNSKERCMNAFAATKQASVARCIICNIQVPKTLKNLMDHLLGSSHIKKEKSVREAQPGSSQAAPVTVTKKSRSENRQTFKSASDTITIGGKWQNKDFFFSWV